MPRTILIPGLGGSPAPHWQDWWQSINPHAVTVTQPDWTAADAVLWDHTVETAIRARPASFVLAHSLGALSLVRLAARDPHLPVRGALLVAPVDVEHGPGAERLGHFGPVPRDLLPFPAFLVASRTDPWLAFDRAEAFAINWGARLIDLGEAGHINDKSGYGPWPTGLGLLEQLARPAMVRLSRMPADFAPSPGDLP